MKSPTQQAIIFLLEEYVKERERYVNQYGNSNNSVSTPEIVKAQELLEEVKDQDIHNDPDLEGRL